jgi:hypothetical protein
MSGDYAYLMDEYDEIEHRAKPEQCAIIHHLLTGHEAGGSNGYADCECGKEWHWPITEEQQQEFERERIVLRDRFHSLTVPKDRR